MTLTRSRNSIRNFILCILLLGISGAATAAPTPTWSQLSPANSPPARSYLAMTYDPSLPAREGAGMAYDPLLGHIIVFGGQNNEVPLGDTWELLP